MSDVKLYLEFKIPEGVFQDDPEYCEPDWEIWDMFCSDLKKLAETYAINITDWEEK